jgi:formylglycine-generating enzyme required for sulfatase activity
MSRSVRSGHGDIDEKTLPPNTLIAYAQKAGATAEDGTSSNSPYTTALLKHLPTPGLDVELALRRVRDEVLQATRNRQEPFKYGSLGGAELTLVPAAINPQASLPTAVPAMPVKLSEAAEAWDRTKDTTSIAALEAFIARYKDTYYADLARLKIEELKKQQVVVAVPPKAPPHEPQPKPAAVVRPPTPCIAGSIGAWVRVGNEWRCLKPKDAFKDCDTCPEMVVVPAGSFTMGSPANEAERARGEQQVRVSIPAPFAVGKYAVTFDEWDVCVADGGCNGYTPSDLEWGRGKRPVVLVNWNNAKAYATWLSRKSGKTYRLLSEAEREYVTRAASLRAAMIEKH